jgi:CubicO group peptidase (beta-lactamase class C family)
MESLRLVERWHLGRVASGVTTAAGTVSTHGAVDEAFAWASVTKLATTLAVLVATEEGILGLDDAVLEWGATVRHVLAHTAGMAPEPPPAKLYQPATRRVYSNAGFELLGELVSRASEMPFGAYLSEAVLEPLGMDGTVLRGSPAWGISGPLTDLLRLGRELLAPSLLAPATLAEATAPAFGELPGVLPGFGMQRDCAFGLGFEVKDHKDPHWTAPPGSPRTFGHFGRSGTFLWVDPEVGLACAVATDREFGPWAVSAWPAFSAAVLSEWLGSVETDGTSASPAY